MFGLIHNFGRVEKASHTLFSLLPVQTPGAVHGAAELDGKERSSSKKTKGPSANHGMIGGKTADGGKTASGSGNDGGTHRWPATYLMLELLLCFFLLYLLTC